MSLFEDILENLDLFDIDGETPLDEGIRRYVLILRAQGIETFESCQGGEGHSFTEPTVRFHGNQVEGYRAFAAAMNYGLPVSSLRRYYQVIDGQLEGPSWEMTFPQQHPEHHETLLAEGIRQIGVTIGMIPDDASLTGPELVAMADNITVYLKAERERDGK